jgi:hypothetical protein
MRLRQTPPAGGGAARSVLPAGNPADDTALIHAAPASARAYAVDPMDLTEGDVLELPTVTLPLSAQDDMDRPYPEVCREIAAFSMLDSKRISNMHLMPMICTC